MWVGNVSKIKSKYVWVSKGISQIINCKQWCYVRHQESQEECFQLDRGLRDFFMWCAMASRKKQTNKNKQTKKQKKTQQNLTDDVWTVLLLHSESPGWISLNDACTCISADGTHATLKQPPSFFLWVPIEKSFLLFGSTPTKHFRAIACLFFEIFKICFFHAWKVSVIKGESE